MLEKINALLRHAAFPASFRILMLLAFLTLVTLGLGAYSTDAAFLRQLRNTNFANLLVWAYWWPLIVIVTVLLGRVWCLVCPLELIVSSLAKIGLKKKPPAWLSSGWGITIFYIIILFIGIQGLWVHRNPALMASYLLVIVAAAAATALVYEKNTFCRCLCPMGHLLGLYARLSFLGWRVKDREVCKKCKDKSCIDKKLIYNLSTKSCGVGLYPGRLDDNTACILCTGCLKACEKHNTTGMAGRPNPGFQNIGFAADHFKARPLKGAEAFFLLVLSGFVMQEILPHWKVAKKILFFLPELLKEYLPAKSSIVTGLEESLVLYLLIPFMVFLVPYLAGLLFGGRLSLRDYFKHVALAFLPVTALAHLAKALMKMAGRIPYFEHSFSDLTGMSTARSILEGSLSLSPVPGWIKGAVTVLATFVIILAIYLSIKTVAVVNKKIMKNGAKGWAFYLIPIMYGGIYLTSIIAFRVQGL